MRKTLIFVLSFVMVVMAASGVSASSDCERWLSDYKRALADKPTTQKLLAAKHRAHAYAHRKIGQLTSSGAPLPHPARLASTHPHLAPAQMVKRFDLLCGDLPTEPQVLDARMAPDEFISEMSLGGPVEAEAVPDDAVLLAEDEVPPYDGPNVTGGASAYGPSYGPYVPTYGPTLGGGAGSAPAVSSVLLPAVPALPALPPVAAVPEPSSLVLLATGSMCALGMARRRFGRGSDATAVSAEATLSL